MGQQIDVVDDGVVQGDPDDLVDRSVEIAGRNLQSLHRHPLL
jgi:hypothetical protein